MWFVVGDVLTSAGTASALDACLHLVRGRLGADAANRVARSLVIAPHREGGQAQFIEQPVPAGADTSTAAARDWALRHLEQQISLQDLARRSSMSVRTFTRRFRAELGLSPGRWLAEQRLYLARRLLEETDLPIDTVATRAGFGTGTSMRNHFQETLGVSPRGYRDTFRTAPERSNRARPAGR